MHHRAAALSHGRRSAFGSVPSIWTPRSKRCMFASTQASIWAGVLTRDAPMPTTPARTEQHDAVIGGEESPAYWPPQAFRQGTRGGPRDTKAPLRPRGTALTLEKPGQPSSLNTIRDIRRENVRARLLSIPRTTAAVHRVGVLRSAAGADWTRHEPVTNPRSAGLLFERPDPSHCQVHRVSWLGSLPDLRATNLLSRRTSQRPSSGHRRSSSRADEAISMVV